MAISSYVLSINLSVINASNAFFLLPTRSWELLFGSLLFIYPLKSTLRVKQLMELTGLGLIFFSVVYFTEDTVWPGYLALLPVLGAGLIILSANENSFVGRSKLLGWFGKTSYSIYLWHWPIVVAINHFNLHTNSYAMVTGILLSILIGYLSFKFIESTTRNVKPVKANSDISSSKIERIPLPLIYFSVCAVFAVIIKVSNGIPSRVNEKVLIADGERKNKNPRSKACVVTHRGDIISPECVFGNNQAVIKSVVLGDSHSNSLVNSVSASITDNSGGVTFMGANACHAPMDIKHINFQRCNLYNKWVLNELDSNAKYDQTPVIIINKGMQFYPKRFEMMINDFTQGTERFKKAYKENFQQDICHLSQKHPVYLMLPIPEMPVDVPVYLGKSFMVSENVDDVTLPLAQYQADNKEVINLYNKVSRHCGVTLLDPTPYLCPEGTCMGSIAGRPLYYDDDHISEYGNTFLIPMFSSIWESNE